MAARYVLAPAICLHAIRICLGGQHAGGVALSRRCSDGTRLRLKSTRAAADQWSSMSHAPRLFDGLRVWTHLECSRHGVPLSLIRTSALFFTPLLAPTIRQQRDPSSRVAGKRTDREVLFTDTLTPAASGDTPCAPRVPS